MPRVKERIPRERYGGEQERQRDVKGIGTNETSSSDGETEWKNPAIRDGVKKNGVCSSCQSDHN